MIITERILYIMKKGIKSAVAFVRGWIKNDAKIKVHLDDEMKAYVSSNVEEE